MTKYKFVQWVLSTWIIQMLMRGIFKGWCFVRKDDKRFKFSEALEYAGDPDAASGHRPSNWNTYVCIQAPNFWTFPHMYVMFDIHTGQRFAFLRRYFTGEQYIVFKVGHESAMVLFGSRGTTVASPGPRLIGRWTGDKEDLTPEMREWGFTPDNVTYI